MRKTKFRLYVEWSVIYILAIAITSQLCIFLFKNDALFVCFYMGIIIGQLCILGYMKDEERISK